MGTVLEKEGLSYQDRRFLDLFQISHTYIGEKDDDRLGHISLYQNNSDQQQLVAVKHCYPQETSSSSQHLVENYLQPYLRNFNSHKNILRLITFEVREELLICGSNGQLDTYYEYFKENLEGLINRRYQSGVLFTEEELILLLQSLVNVLILLEKHNRQLNDVRPQNIFIKMQNDQLSEIKTLPFRCMVEDQSAASKVINLAHSCLLSPEALQELHTNQAFSQNPAKSDLFSVGMTVLWCATLQSSSICYDYSNFTIKFDFVQQMLQSLKYSNSFIQLLSQILNFDPNSRPTALQYQQSIKLYETSRMAQFNFRQDMHHQATNSYQLPSHQLQPYAQQSQLQQQPQLQQQSHLQQQNLQQQQQQQLHQQQQQQQQPPYQIPSLQTSQPVQSHQYHQSMTQNNYQQFQSQVIGAFQPELMNNQYYQSAQLAQTPMVQQPPLMPQPPQMMQPFQYQQPQHIVGQQESHFQLKSPQPMGILNSRQACSPQKLITSGVNSIQQLQNVANQGYQAPQLQSIEIPRSPGRQYYQLGDYAAQQSVIQQCMPVQSPSQQCFQQQYVKPQHLSPQRIQKFYSIPMQNEPPKQYSFGVSQQQPSPQPQPRVNSGENFFRTNKFYQKSSQISNENFQIPQQVSQIQQQFSFVPQNYDQVRSQVRTSFPHNHFLSSLQPAKFNNLQVDENLENAPTTEVNSEYSEIRNQPELQENDNHINQSPIRKIQFEYTDGNGIQPENKENQHIASYLEQMDQRINEVLKRTQETLQKIEDD